MDDFSVQIGNKLRLLREEKGYTIRDVEAKTEIPKSTINSYENGTFDQKIGILKKLSDLFNEDINWIIGEVETRRHERK